MRLLFLMVIAGCAAPLAGQVKTLEGTVPQLRRAPAGAYKAPRAQRPKGRLPISTAWTLHDAVDPMTDIRTVGAKLAAVRVSGATRPQEQQAYLILACNRNGPWASVIGTFDAVSALRIRWRFDSLAPQEDAWDLEDAVTANAPDAERFVPNVLRAKRMLLEFPAQGGGFGVAHFALPSPTALLRRMRAVCPEVVAELSSVP